MLCSDKCGIKEEIIKSFKSFFIINCFDMCKIKKDWRLWGLILMLIFFCWCLILLILFYCLFVVSNYI